VCTASVADSRRAVINKEELIALCTLLLSTDQFEPCGSIATKQAPKFILIEGFLRTFKTTTTTTHHALACRAVSLLLLLRPAFVRVHPFCITFVSILYFLRGPSLEDPYPQASLYTYQFSFNNINIHHRTFSSRSWPPTVRSSRGCATSI
jgi:hypothetical protein